jgi:hypothetical protein
VVTPEVPRGDAIRQAVFDHHLHSQGDDPLGVVTSGGCEVRQISAEVKATGLAAVLRVKDVKVARPVSIWAAEVVENSMPQGVAITAPTTVRTAAATVVTRALLDKRSGQVLNTGNALGAVRDVFSGWHSSLSSTKE